MRPPSSFFVEEPSPEYTADGQLKLPVDDAVEQIVRPELNTQKFSDFIFPHSKTKNLGDLRSRSWQVPLPDGKETTASLTVAPIVRSKAPTYYSYKVLLALFSLWQDGHESDGSLKCSYRAITRRLKINMDGRAVARLERHLDSLADTSLTWRLAFVSGEKGTPKSLKKMHILDGFDYEHPDPFDAEDPKFTDGRLHIRFNSHILSNLDSNRTKPIRLDVILSFKNELAGVLYNRIDLFLAGRERYERNSEGLFEELELAGSRYRYPSQRKEKLKPLVAELNGKMLSTGHTLKVNLAKTRDGVDWKIVCKRTGEIAPDRPRRRLKAVNDDDAVDALIYDVGAVVGNSEAHRGLYASIGRHYSATMIHRALGEFKSEGGYSARSRRRFFVAIVHRLAHELGHEWLKECGNECKYRAENRLF